MIRLKLSHRRQRSFGMIPVFQLVCSVLAILATSHAVEAVRPNIVLILADDLGYETVGCYGGTSYETPNIDRLAAEGIRFDHAYAMPLCTNTRVQLMTGKYNNRNWKAFGILDPKEDTFGHMLQRAGYKTCIAGKWQLYSYDPPNYPGAALRRNTGLKASEAGFDEYSLWHTGQTEDKGSRYADPVIDQNGKLRTDTTGEYGPDLWVDFIGDFMQRHRDEPFFVYYPMALPHNPMNPTPDSPEWADRQRRHSDETQFAADMIEYTDKLVGRLVAKIDDLGLRKNTLVLFCSDNGTNARVASEMGARRVRGEKGLGTDLGIRVPMFATWPGTTPTGQVSNDLIDSADFLPTIMELAGANDQIRDDIDGISFANVVRGNGASKRKWIYVHQDPRPGWDKDRFYLMRLARNQDYKLRQDGRLYCTRDDPFEESPIFASQDNRETLAVRVFLQQVLDSMKPHTAFDPASMPRPNPTPRFENNEFHDMGGYAIAEAELLPTPRDESWRAETNIPNYTGTAYLRSLRDQQEAGKTGATPIHFNIGTAGSWNVSFRARTDHVGGQDERAFWMRVGDGKWLIGRLTQNHSAGHWHWTNHLTDPETGQVVSARFYFKEKRNTIWIAPRSMNFKLDRVAVYEDDREQKATSRSTPVSPFHPWASP